MIKIRENFKKEELFDCGAHNLLFSSPSFNPSEREPTLALLLRGPLWLSGSLKSAQTVWSGIFHRVIGAKERRLGRSWSLAKTPDFLLVSFDVIWDFFFSFLQEHTVAPLWTAPDGAGAAQRLPALPPTWPQRDGARGIFMSIRKHSSGVYWFPEMRSPQAEREIKEIITKHGQLVRLSSETSLCHMAAKPSDTFFYKHLQGEWIYSFFSLYPNASI